MVNGRQSILLDEHFTANGAMLAFRQARLRTRRRDCLVDHLGMRSHRDNFLLDEYGVADRAMLAFRQTRLCASGRDCFIDHHGMRSHRDNFLLGEHGAADGAMLAFRQTRLCASGRDCFIDHHGMRGHRNALRIAASAGRASVGHLAFLLACRLLRLLTHIVVRDRRDNFLLDEHGAAYRTMLALRQSRLRAGWFDRCVDHLGMRNHRDNFLLDEYGAADRAMLALRQPRLCARRRDCLVDHLGMRRHRNALRIAAAAARASVGHLAFLLACRFLGLLSHIVVRDRRDNFLLDEHSAAHRAFLPLREARFRAGRRNGGDNFRSVRGKFAVLRVTYRTLRLADTSRQAAAVGGFVHFEPAANACLPMIYTVRKPLISRCMYNMSGGGFDDIFTNSTFHRGVFARLIPIRDMRSNILPCTTTYAGMPMLIFIIVPIDRVVVSNHRDDLLFN